MTPCPDFSAEYLREILAYDSETGDFRWLKCASSKPARITGTIATNGYRYITINYKKYAAHQLAWYHFFGVWPDLEVDHKDCDRANNQIANLRLATRRQQCANSRAKCINSSEFKAVGWRADKRKWVAQIRMHGKQTYLGLFDTPEEAHAAYTKASVISFGEFARSA